jgi:acyl-coenzyme A thioesterase PaaI-like protein
MWKNNRCWVCGPDHPEGLRVVWELGTPVTTRLTIPDRYQGFNGVAHGGTVAAVCDDGMWYAVLHTTGMETATVELSVRYHRPVPVGVPVAVSTWADPPRHGMVSARAEVMSDAGEVLASAHGRFMRGTSLHTARRQE